MNRIASRRGPLPHRQPTRNLGFAALAGCFALVWLGCTPTTSAQQPCMDARSAEQTPPLDASAPPPPPPEVREVMAAEELHERALHNLLRPADG